MVTFFFLMLVPNVLGRFYFPLRKCLMHSDKMVSPREPNYVKIVLVSLLLIKSIYVVTSECTSSTKGLCVQKGREGIK